MTPEERALDIIPASQILLPEDAQDYREEIAKHIREAVAEERAACATLTEDWRSDDEICCADIAAAIRARSEPK